MSSTLNEVLNEDTSSEVASIDAGELPRYSNPFAHFIALLNDGALNRDASGELRKLLSRCDQTGGKGTLTLTITVDAERTDHSGEALISTKLASKLPDYPRGFHTLRHNDGYFHPTLF
ncbi:hypothetical protein [Trueperella bialowiezensis]|uniref:Uncharacterized protein n=1 Tax=Trueperella bialowiezensis TaxID=312285 RepID=A0A448PE72_9ACTO|nr:hypothetical protein [Trueperella bialowiezensis]VEI13237.1 Uncharacterised protein [Trueperella bialowiezensis]